MDPSRPELLPALERLEYLIVAATLLGDEVETTEPTLVFGRDKYQVKRQTLQHSGNVVLPSTGRSSMLGTSFMPALGFGSLQPTPDGAFVRVMPRGVDLHNIKQTWLHSPRIAWKIVKGGTLTLEEVQAEWQVFCANVLPRSANQRESGFESAEMRSLDQLLSDA